MSGGFGDDLEELTAPVVGNQESDALDEPMSPAALWAMEDRKRSFRRLAPDDPGRVECHLGTDGTSLYVIEDGDDNCMVCRLVGGAPDGCVYCLVGRVSVYRYEQLRDGEVDLEDAFADAGDLCLCSVFESESAASNLFVVQRYKTGADIPEEYLPPSPYIDFTDD